MALTVLLATAAGVLFERRFSGAGATARGILQLMLYVLVPFVSFVNIAHLHLTVSGATGLLLAHLATAVAGVAAWAAGRALALDRPGTGALICSVILVNTGYLGLPMTVTLLGPSHLPAAIAYDQLVGAPILFLAGFAVGAAYGTRAGEGLRARSRAFLTRNPPLLAVLAGLAAPAALAPGPLLQASHVVVAALLPLGFLVVGINISAERREDAAPLLERPSRPVVVAVALRLLVASSLLSAISLTLLHLPSPYLLQAAMPCGINALLVGHAFGLDQRMIATAIVWSTTVAIIVASAVVALG